MHNFPTTSLRLVKAKLALTVAGWLLSTSSALAAPFIFNGVVVVSGGGLIAPNANYGCPAGSANCLTSLDFQLVSSTPASGVIEEGYQPGSSLEVGWISLQIASVTFAPTSGSGPNIEFTNLDYEAFVPVQHLSLIQSGPGTGTITGMVNGTPFSTASAVYNLACAGSGGGLGFHGQCGVAFGPQLFTADGHDWLNTFNVTTVAGPEPELAALVLLGLTGLALRRR
jgi:MYXO-CTERM domain-containing protein